MHELSRHDRVEKISLPRRYQAHGSSHSYHELQSRYEDLKKEYIQAMERIDETSRGAWAIERMADTLQDRLDAKDVELARLAEAGRYAVYGKQPLSTVDDCTDEAYTDGEVDDNKINNK